MQRLESAREQLLPRLHAPVVAGAPSGAAARPLPEVVDVALGLIEAARHVLVADQLSRDDNSNWGSEEDEPLEDQQDQDQDQQAPGSACSVQSSSTTPAQLSGFTIGILTRYRKGSLETRKQLMRGSLCVLALSSLQPRHVPDGHGDGVASGGGTNGCGVVDGWSSGCSNGVCGLLPSTAVRQLQLDRMSLHVFHGWAELTLVEIKSCSNGMTGATRRLQRSATFLLCAYHILRERAGFCREQLPEDIKANGVVVARAVIGGQGPEPVALRPACGPMQMLDVDVLRP